MANLINPKTIKLYQRFHLRVVKITPRNNTGYDELRNSNSDGSNSRKDLTYTGCS